MSAKALAPFALGLLGVVAGLLLFDALRSEPAPITGADVEAAVTAALEAASDDPPVAAEVFQVILPSLVYIRTEGNEERTDGQGVGSGVIVNMDGSILTALHVVQGARAIRVTFADGTEAAADVVSAEPERDLAVLMAQRPPEVIVPAVLGGGGTVGDPTFAVGNPLGLVASLSAGVISGLDRSIPRPHTGETLAGLIQFDAAVNPGSSGGPLLDRDGRVIGIVTAYANAGIGETFTGVGFAVPLGSAAGGSDGPPR